METKINNISGAKILEAIEYLNKVKLNRQHDLIGLTNIKVEARNIAEAIVEATKILESYEDLDEKFKLGKRHKVIRENNKKFYCFAVEQTK